MSGYSPSRLWPDRGQGFGEGPPISRLPEANNFSDMGYSEEPLLNGGVGPPHGFQGPNRDFQRQPCSPASGVPKWNPGFFTNNFRQEPPPRGQYNKWMEHGNSSPRFSDHSNGSPRLSDSELGRLEGHSSPGINKSSFGGRRRRGDLPPRGHLHRFYEQQHSQQDREADMDRIQPPYVQPFMSDSFHHDYHHGEYPLHERGPGDFQSEELQHGELIEHGEFQHLHRSCRGVFPPRGFPSPRGEERLGTSSFQGPRARPYSDSYSSPVLNTSPWSPTCDSPDSPVPKPILPYLKGRGSPHSFSPRREDMSHVQQRRPLPPSSQQKFGHNSRIHEKAGGPINEVGSSLHGRQDRLDPRRRDYNAATENSNKNEPLIEDPLPASTEVGDFLETRDPRLRKSVQKPQHLTKQHEEIALFVRHDHCYYKIDDAGKDDGENVEENITYEIAVINSPLASSFLSVIEKGMRRLTSKQERNVHSVHETLCTSSELSLESRPQSITSTCEPQSSSAQPSLTGLISAMTEPKSIMSKPDSLPNVSKECLPSLDQKKSECEAIHPSEDTANSSCGIIQRRTSTEEEAHHPFVFSLNDFNLDLDTEPSSAEEGEMAYSPAPSMLRIEEGSNHSPQWAITKNDLGKCIRFAKVDATTMSAGVDARISPGSNGRSTPVKLATYASKSSPVVARNENIMKIFPRKRKRRRKKIVAKENDGELEEGAAEVTSSPEAMGKYYIDAGDEDGDNEEMDGDYFGSTSEHFATEAISSGLLKAKRARRIRSPRTMLEESDETEKLIGGKEPEGRRSRRQKIVPFKGFKPEVLTTRSRTETATLKRRNELEKEIEKNERERLRTAIEPHDDLESSPSVSHSLDLSLDDSSVVSMTSSSIQSSVRDLEEGSFKANLLAQFTSDVVASRRKVTGTRSSGDTSLHTACRQGKYEVARYMILVDGLDVNAQCNAGWGPLHEACNNGRLKLVELLLKCGADVNIGAKDGTRPLHDAIESGSFDIIKLLLQYGADPMAEKGEKTPLEFALQHHQYEIHDHLEKIVEEKKRLESKKVSSASPASIKKKPTRASRKGELMKQAGRSQAAIPVDGYGSDGIVCGEELDYPLFYVSPIIELSDCPFLPVYNFQLSSGVNPRKHNFHLISDILNCLDLTEEMLLEYCDKVSPVEFPVAEVLQQVNSSSTSCKLPESIMSVSHTKKLKFLPLCQQLRELLDITIENLDD